MFLKPDNKALYQKAKALKKSDLKESWFLDIVEKMKNIAGVNQSDDKNKTIMVGLAAPQIGYSVQLVFVDAAAEAKRNGKFGNNIFMVNPEILFYGKKKQIGREGCYSTRTDTCHFDGIVSRSESVTVKYLDLDGSIKTETFIGFTAVIVQHEVDHLNGKVFIHKIKKEKDLHIVFESEMLKYRKGWKTWKRTVDPKLYWKDIAKIV